MVVRLAKLTLNHDAYDTRVAWWPSLIARMTALASRELAIQPVQP
jgi:hypothetical protein